MNKWGFKTDIKLASYLPYGLIVFSLIFNVLIAVFKNDIPVGPASGGRFSSSLFFITDLAFPLFLLFSILFMISNDFASNTFEFMQSLPIHSIRLIFFRFLRLVCFYLILFVLTSVNIYYIANGILAESNAHVTLAMILFLTLPNAFFFSSLALLLVTFTRNAFYSTALAAGLIIFELLSHGLFSNKLMLFVNLFGYWFPDKTVTVNRIFYIALSLFLLLLSYLSMHFKVFLKSGDE